MKIIEEKKLMLFTPRRYGKSYFEEQFKKCQQEKEKLITNEAWSATMSNKLTLTYDSLTASGVEVELNGIQIPEVINGLTPQAILEEMDYRDIAIFITNLNKDERELLNKYISDNEDE